MQARVIGTGAYLPEKVLTNADMEKLVETSDEWIVTRTGIRERRIAKAEEVASDLGAKAAKQAIDNAKVAVADIDCILVATSTPDYLFPSTACMVQQKLGIQAAPAADILAACSGFIYGLSMAKAWVEAGMYKNVLLVAAEKLSTITDYEDRTTCVLFGDGACSAVVSAEGKGLAIESACLGADGGQGDLVILPGGGSQNPASEEMLAERLQYIKMNGREVFRHAVRRMESAVNHCLDSLGLSESDIDWLVPHQANERIIDAMAKRYSLPAERVYKTVSKYGNTSASSVGIALHELLENKQELNPNHIMLVAFGGGLTWGAVFLKQIEA